jgi:hypothetical protein
MWICKGYPDILGSCISKSGWDIAKSRKNQRCYIISHSYNYDWHSSISWTNRLL